MKHLGLEIFERKYGFKLTRENFAVVNPRSSFSLKMDITKEKFGIEMYADDAGRTYTDEWCQWHLKNCLENFDLSMKYFTQLDREEFAGCINAFLQNNPLFIPVTDLKLCWGKPGYYLLVLDEYCQAYIGTSEDMTRRIRQHWSSHKSFDRMLFPIGNVAGSIVPIDSFRALDTTRIYARQTTDIYGYEDPYIKQIPGKFLANRIQGGRFLEDFALPEIKTRELVKS